MKSMICTTIGLVGSAIASCFGGWTAAMTTLLIFMVIDYITGLVVAGVFHKSKKTENGALESKAGFKGLCKKCMILLFVLIGYRLDIAIGTEYIKDAVCIGFMVNELISIIENAGLMGMYIPAPIIKAIDMLKDKNETM
jgi:toxin secretion/phage lysis holin